MDTDNRKSSESTDTQSLRQKAKQIVDKTPTQKNLEDLTDEEIGRLMYELEVHQIELEIQNITLQETQLSLERERKRYFDLYDLAPIAYCTLNDAGAVQDANFTATTLLDVERDKILGHPLSHFILNEDQDIYYFFRKRSLRSDEPQSCELRMRKKDGTLFWTYLTIVRSEEPEGVLTFRLIINDISERKASEEALRIAAIAFKSENGIVVTDSESIILKVNPAFTRLTGYSAEEAVGQTMKLLKSGRQGLRYYQLLWKELKREKRWQGEIWDKRKNGEIFAALLTITAVVNPDEDVTHYVANFSDITANKEAEAKIHRLAHYDTLTELPNRRLFQDRLEQAIASSARSHSYGAILFIDVDNFKELNDTRGHDVGDQLLTLLSQRLHESLRKGDTVARQGGDEFIVLLQHLDTDINKAADAAKSIGQKLLDAVSMPFLLGTYEYHCRLSLGIGIFNQNDKIEELFKHADIALYQAKKTGGNALLFFDPKMQTAIDERNTLTHELQQALTAGQLRLLYQPQVDSMRNITGVEALVRWQHPEHGWMLPDDFIPLAEETGLILPIGQWILKTACEQLKEWESDALTRELKMAVNISARQFRQPDFVKQLENVLESSGADPKRLNLELTESLIIENIQENIEKMHTIKKLGVSFSMDDFGTGFSSLAYLASFPLDQLKIDRSFVTDITVNDNDAMIARTIVNMGLGLNMHVIAEGVETEEQYKFLETLGCQAYQGYLFSQPIDADSLNRLLRQTNS